MADYAEGDEQLQDAFEEGNGDAAHDEVSHSAATGAFCILPSSTTSDPVVFAGTSVYARQTCTVGGREKENGGTYSMSNVQWLCCKASRLQLALTGPMMYLRQKQRKSFKASLSSQ
jgi:hypothetical protein